MPTSERWVVPCDIIMPATQSSGDLKKNPWIIQYTFLAAIVLFTQDPMDCLTKSHREWTVTYQFVWRIPLRNMCGTEIRRVGTWEFAWIPKIICKSCFLLLLSLPLSLSLICYWTALPRNCLTIIGWWLIIPKT